MSTISTDTSAPQVVRRPRREGTPPGLGVAAAFAVALLVLPLLALLVRAPWADLPQIIVQPSVLSAMRLSLFCASAATAIALVLGVPLAWWLARTDSHSGNLVRALVTLPLVMPPVVGGVALLMAFGRNGVVGRSLDTWFGFTMPFTTTAVVIAETFVAMPFLIVSVEGALRSADRGLVEAAATLGASPWRVFWRITLPLARPAVIAGTVLCWARALGEFGATMMFAGNFPGRTQTMPLAVYVAMESDPDAALGLSLLLLSISVVILLGLRHRWLSPSTAASG